MPLLIPTEDYVLELLQTEHALSPEEILTALEDALELGEITEEQLYEALK